MCAGAVLESHRLAMVVPADAFFPMRARIVPRHPQSSFKALPGRPNAAPGGPKCTPRLPKVPQRGPKGSQKRDKRSAMQSPKHALAFQSEFKGILYTPKLPINRSSGHYSYKHVFWGSDLVRIDSGIFRNMFKNDFMPRKHPAFCVSPRIINSQNPELGYF